MKTKLNFAYQLEVIVHNEDELNRIINDSKSKQRKFFSYPNEGGFAKIELRNNSNEVLYFDTKTSSIEMILAVASIRTGTTYFKGEPLYNTEDHTIIECDSLEGCNVEPINKFSGLVFRRPSIEEIINWYDIKEGKSAPHSFGNKESDFGANINKGGLESPSGTFISFPSIHDKEREISSLIKEINVLKAHIQQMNEFIKAKDSLIKTQKEYIEDLKSWLRK